MYKKLTVGTKVWYYRADTDGNLVKKESYVMTQYNRVFIRISGTSDVHSFNSEFPIGIVTHAHVFLLEEDDALAVKLLKEYYRTKLKEAEFKVEKVKKVYENL
mgnify:CR=1 FL=1